MKRRKGGIQHQLNFLHVMCRLVDLGFPWRLEKRVCRPYGRIFCRLVWSRSYIVERSLRHGTA
ncbi:MAG: hypothetical protein DRG82_13620 [Deltaproteobacteria bacterium]|nr:MAG: hypothetical protein DRG82_13620 [Deltaproteobacteria bacterium]